jgi:hypothetical protein
VGVGVSDEMKDRIEVVEVGRVGVLDRVIVETVRIFSKVAVGRRAWLLQPTRTRRMSNKDMSNDRRYRLFFMANCYVFIKFKKLKILGTYYS